MHNSFRTSHFKDYKHLPIYQVLSAEGIGQWPILQGSSWNRSEFNLERLLGQLFTHQVQSIFQLYVTQDEVEPTKDLLQVRYLTIIIFCFFFSFQVVISLFSFILFPLWKRNFHFTFLYLSDGSRYATTNDTVCDSERKGFVIIWGNSKTRI